MTDIVDRPNRSVDSWSLTEVRTLTHQHVWTVKGFSQTDCRYMETTLRVNDGSLPVNQPLVNDTTPNPYVFSSTTVSKFKAKFTVLNTRNEEVPATVYTGTQQLNGYFEYIRRDTLLSHIQPDDIIRLSLNLTIVADTITKSSHNTIPPPLPESRPVDVAQDMELVFSNEKHSDFKIICKNEKENKEIRVHKVVLTARSPVFAAMLEVHTEEALNNQVVFDDIDSEVMKEMLLFMYTGRCPNLNMMAMDLLAVADRFQLNGLKEMADQVKSVR